MITCEHLLEFLTDYIENALPPEERSRFEQHLAACPECVNYLHNFHETIRAARCACQHLQACGTDQIPESLVQAILAARRNQ